MKKLYKFSKAGVFFPLILFLSTSFIVYKMIEMVINEPEEYFNYGKIPIYFVILINLCFCFGLLALTIYNYKKSGSDNKRYLPEEKEKLILQNKQNSQKELKLIILLPMAIMFTLVGGCLTYIGFKIGNVKKLIFIFIGIIFFFIGIIMLKIFFEKGD